MTRLLLAILALLAPLAPAKAQMDVSSLFAASTSDTIQYAVPTSGQTVVIDPSVAALVLNNAGLLATLTITLPAAPADGQRIVVTSGAGVTLLTVNGNGITVKGTIATLAINGYARFIYSASANAWFRTG